MTLVYFIWLYINEYFKDIKKNVSILKHCSDTEVVTSKCASSTWGRQNGITYNTSVRSDYLKTLYWVITTQTGTGLAVFVFQF